MEIKDILTQEGIQLANDIRANMGAAGMNVSNETANSLSFEIKTEGTKTTFLLYGRPYFMTVQTGRKPTPGKKPSREMIDNITRWVEGRNMDSEAVWAIATKIQEKGTKLWQQGGRKDIVDPAIEDFVDEVGHRLTDQQAELLTAKVQQMKW
jgi:post-segregation antitoxin (ccd killing protein)